MTWPTDWEGRHEIVASDLKVFRAAPFVAWSFGKLRIAAFAQVDFGRLQIRRDLDFIDMEGDVAIDMDGRAWGGGAAAYYQPTRDLAFGAVFRSGTKLALDGGANFTAPEAFAAKLPDQAAQSAIALPAQLSLGGKYVRGPYSLLADIDLTRWSTNKQLVVDFAEMTTPDVVQDQQWRDTISVRAGGEYRRGRLTLRHGTYVEQSPAPVTKLAPSSPDANRLGLVVGASWKLTPALRVDGFVEQMFLLRRDAENDEALEASYAGGPAVLCVGDVEVRRRGPRCEVVLGPRAIQRARFERGPREDQRQVDTQALAVCERRRLMPRGARIVVACGAGATGSRGGGGLLGDREATGGGVAGDQQGCEGELVHRPSPSRNFAMSLQPRKYSGSTGIVMKPCSAT